MLILPLTFKFIQILIIMRNFGHSAILFAFVSLCLHWLGTVVKDFSPKRCLLVVFLIIFWSVSALYAAEMDFSVSSGLGYDSNVLRSSTDQEHDLYFKLAPKLALIMPLYRTYFDISSSGLLEQHVNRKDANLLELIFSGRGRYNLLDHVSFGLNDEFIISDRLRSAEQLTDFARRREFISNRISTDLQQAFRDDSLTMSLGYSNSIRDYQDNSNDNWMAHKGQFRIKSALGYKTSVELNVGLIEKDYEADVNYLSIPVSASFGRQLSNKFTVSCSFGMENRKYNESYQDHNWNEPVISFSITGNLTPKTASRLTLQRRAYDSDFSVGQTFISKAAILLLALRLSDATSLNVEGLYTRNDYTLFKWTSDIYSGSAKIQYRLVKRGAISLSYGYEKWESNFLDILNYGYDKHVVDISYVVIF